MLSISFINCCMCARGFKTNLYETIWWKPCLSNVFWLTIKPISTKRTVLISLNTKKTSVYIPMEIQVMATNMHSKKCRYIYTNNKNPAQIRLYGERPHPHFHRWLCLFTLVAFDHLYVFCQSTYSILFCFIYNHGPWTLYCSDKQHDVHIVSWFVPN